MAAKVIAEVETISTRANWMTHILPQGDTSTIQVSTIPVIDSAILK